MGKLSGFAPLAAHLSCYGQGGIEELGGACPGREDEHTLRLLGLVVISQHVPGRKQRPLRSHASCGTEARLVPGGPPAGPRGGCHPA